MEHRNRKLEGGHGYERDARVTTNFSIARTEKRITEEGNKPQARGVKYSSTSLFVTRSTNVLASRKVAVMRRSEEKSLKEAELALKNASANNESNDESDDDDDDDDGHAGCNATPGL